MRLTRHIERGAVLSRKLARGPVEPTVARSAAGACFQACVETCGAANALAERGQRGVDHPDRRDVDRVVVVAGDAEQAQTNRDRTLERRWHRLPYSPKSAP